MRLFLVFLGFLTLFSCGNHSIKPHLKLKIIGLPDSIALGFCRVWIFEKSKDVQDTLASPEGEIFIQDAQKIILEYAGYYPKFINIDDLNGDSSIYLLESKSLKMTGGMGLDDSLTSLNKSVLSEISVWNEQQD